jgi:hypothetical protein
VLPRSCLQRATSITVSSFFEPVSQGSINGAFWLGRGRQPDTWRCQRQTSMPRGVAGGRREQRWSKAPRLSNLHEAAG